LFAALPFAQCQASTSYSFPCDKNEYLVAQTNQVPTTVRAPQNTGTCEFIMYCADARSRNIEGTQMQMSKDVHVISFSCGSGASKIEVQSTEKTDGRGELSYAP
jgi:hypothetical protein